MFYLFTFFMTMIFGSFAWELSVFSLVFMLFSTLLNLEGACYSFLLSFGQFSVGLIFLSLFICIFMLYSSVSLLKESFFWSEFCFTTVFITCSLFLCFSISNLFLFYVMFELVSIPTFFMIVGWGYSIERHQSALYMFLYTLSASLPFFLFLLKLYMSNCLFSYEFTYMFASSYSFSSFWTFFSSLVFFVKFPIYFFHIWLPSAHVEAPVAGSMVLAAVLLKLGGYGFFKLLNFIFFSLYVWDSFLFSASIVGSLLMSLVCLRQSDLKSLVAYSSISHMGPVMCSILSVSYLGWTGGFFLMISHGICSSGLFYMLGLLYNRWSSRSFLVLKGLVSISPVMSFWWFALCASNMACPPTINFFSELLMFFTVVSWGFSSVLLVCLLLFFSGAYSIYLFVSLSHGSTVGLPSMTEMSILEIFVVFFHCVFLYTMFSCMSYLM